MFRMISDFVTVWQAESESTLKLFRELTDASLSLRATPETRSIGGLAWHIICSIGEMLTTAGLPLAALPQETAAPVPASAAEIATAYAGAAKAAAEAIAAHWTDLQLDEELPMYGESWKRSFILAVLLGHQTHHRGQLTVLMRMAGLKVAGMYGPAREEWAAAGMQAPD